MEKEVEMGKKKQKDTKSSSSVPWIVAVVVSVVAVFAALSISANLPFNAFGM